VEILRDIADASNPDSFADRRRMLSHA